MNRLLSAVLLVLVAISTHAQSPIEVVTRDGRIVILKLDGTWEFKKPTTEPSATPNPPAVKSNEITSSLSLNFSGHDTDILYSQLIDLKKRLLKSEFETTAQYEKRVVEELQKPIIGNLTTKDTFSIVVSGFQADYDADSQKMHLFLPVEKNSMAELQRRVGGITQESRKSADDLSYINLYKIQLKRERRYPKEGIFFDQTSMLEKKNYSDGFAAEVSLGVEEARRLKPIIKAVVRVRFEDPYAAGYETIDRQFQISLIDIVFFDPQTGKILAKVGQGGK